MKQLFLWTTTVVCMGGLLMSGSERTRADSADVPGTIVMSAEEKAAAQRWIEAHLVGKEAALPFSFIYEGRPSASLMTTWTRKMSRRRLDPARTQITLTWTDPRTRLTARCVCVQYHNFPTVEWTLYFKNGGDKDTPILSEIQALDTTFRRAGEREFILHHQTGSPMGPNDYQPFVSLLPPKESLRFAARAGRGTDPVLPYFNLESDHGGAILVIGWPGQWAAQFIRDDSKSLRVRAGQELTRLRLRPGEEIRSPLVVAQVYRGDWIRGQNLWRRWMLAHNLPRPGGKLPPPQLNACSSHQYGEMIHANEANQIMFVDRYLKEGIVLDYWWMDAGWYINNGSWVNTGTWEVDKKRFPGGLRAITDHARAKGVKSIVWFEPERVTSGTMLARKHPDWLLNAPPEAGSSIAGLQARRLSGQTDPCVTYNPTAYPMRAFGIVWEPGRFALHPGPTGEYCVTRWNAPESAACTLEGEFVGISDHATTDVHILHNGTSLFNGFINVNGQGNRAAFRCEITVQKGDRLDFAVGPGNGRYESDTTGVALTIRCASGKIYRPTDGDSVRKNPSGPWSYGVVPPGEKPDAARFQLFPEYEVGGDGGTKLLNLGNPQARRWLTEHVTRTLREQGIDLYRQDFNMDPLAYWRAADPEDRQGIAEIRHIEGYLTYWDTLQKRFPNMLIDTCASGGRRNDLETLRRAVPLLRSDYILEPVGQQGHTYGIALWMPFFGTGMNSMDSYLFRSAMCPGMIACYDMRPENRADFAPLRRLVAQWREISPCFFGDYYPLTPYSLNADDWIAWQFNLPEKGEGMVQAFRRAECNGETLTVTLQGLDPQGAYQVRNLDGGEWEQSGEELMRSGLKITLAQKPGAGVLVYRRKAR
jgi:alpha-galactosidase